MQCHDFAAGLPDNERTQDLFFIRRPIISNFTRYHHYIIALFLFDRTQSLITIYLYI